MEYIISYPVYYVLDCILFNKKLNIPFFDGLKPIKELHSYFNGSIYRRILLNSMLTLISFYFFGSVEIIHLNQLHKMDDLIRLSIL